MHDLFAPNAGHLEVIRSLASRAFVLMYCVLSSHACAGAPALTIALPRAAGAYMQIVAHQDDDLLFMNPDVQNTIRAGQATLTVYVTAGEADKPGGETFQPPLSLELCGSSEPDREQYANCRQQGIRAAYAQMAGARTGSPWRSEHLTVNTQAGPRTIQVETLAADGPKLSVAFLNLPDRADEDPELCKLPGQENKCYPGHSLKQLWDGGARIATIVPSGPPGIASQSYDKETLLETLTELLNWFRPSVLRVQDTQPDANQREDHEDHIIAASLGTDAFYRYGSPRAQLMSYRDYNINDGQENLEPTQVAEKAITFRSYAVYDKQIPSNDLDYNRWPSRLYHRWWSGTKWVGRNLDGRLQVLAVLNGKLVTWWQAADGAWQGRRDLGNPGRPLAPWVSVARNADGRLEVFTLELGTYELYSTYQTVPNGDWAGTWTPLGNPTAADETLRKNIGTASATSNADGRIQLFVRNGEGGVSTKWQTTPNGSWSDWLDLGGGPGVQDGLAATTSPAGRIELFAYAIAAGVGVIKHWYQTVANAGFTADPSFPALEPAGPPSVATHADGRLDLFYRLATNAAGARGAQVGHTWQIKPDDAWVESPENLGGHGGIGPISVVDAPHARDGSSTLADARIVIFQRNRNGGVSMTRQTAANAGYQTAWVDTGGFVSHEPALAADANGCILAFVIDGEGNLLINRQTSPGGDSPFSDWSLAGQ